MSALRLGSPTDAATDMGPQADRTQAATISRYLEIGRKEGRAIIGGEKAIQVGDNYIQPTVFTDVSDNSQINTEEVFGPVLILHEFESEAEAIQRANNTECRFPSHITPLKIMLKVVPQMACMRQSSATISTKLYALPVLLRLVASVSIRPRRTARMSSHLEDSRVPESGGRRDPTRFWLGPKKRRSISIIVVESKRDLSFFSRSTLSWEVYRTL